MLVLLVLSSLFLVYVWPQSPAGRAWLLGKAQSELQAQGYDLQFANSAGNPWSYLVLDRAVLSGSGMVVTLEQLELSYFLPSLLLGKLPLSVRAEGVQGDLTLGALRLPQGGGRGLAVQPVFRTVDIQHVALNIDDVPYTLPNLSVSELSVTGQADGFLVAGALTTPDGRAEVRAVVIPEPFEIRGEVLQADLRVGRHWWAGVEGGTATGTFRVHQDRIVSDFEVLNGTVTLAGANVTDIGGQVHYTHPVVDAELSGWALGGPVQGRGHVDIANQQWHAEVAGEVALLGAAEWLAEDRLPFDVTSAPMTGTADLSLTISGWQAINLQGSAAGTGSFAERPLETDVQFGFSTGRGVNVLARASYADAPISLTLDPSADGFTLSAQATEVPVGPLTGDLDVDYRTHEGQLTGRSLLELRGEMAGRTLEVHADATHDSDGLNIFLRGQDGAGAALEGAFVVQGDVLQGKATLREFSTPILSGAAEVQLTANGKLDALPLTVTVAGEAPLFLEVNNSRLDTDLRGRVQATLSGAQLSGIQGRFGVLSVSGEATLPSSLNLRYTLPESGLAGDTEGRVQVRDGRLTLGDGRFAARARLLTSEITTDTVILPPLDANVELTHDERLNFLLDDRQNGMLVSMQEGVVAGRFSGTSLSIQGNDAALSGQFRARASEWDTTLSSDLTLTLAEAQLDVKGTDGRLTLDMNAPAGLTLAPITLQQELRVQGTVRLPARVLALRGALGELALDVTGTVDQQGAPRGALHLTSDEERLSLTLDYLQASPHWQLSGSLPLEPVGRLVGLEFSGAVTSDLFAQAGAYGGAMRVRSMLDEHPLYVTLEGTGDGVALRAQTMWSGQTFRLDSQVLPEAGGTLTLGDYGTVVITDQAGVLTASGSGTVPELTSSGLYVAPQTWNLVANMDAQEAELTVGDSTVTTSWGTDGWQVTTNLQQQAAYRDLTLELTGESIFDQAHPSGTVRGALRVSTAGMTESLSIEGSLEAVRLRGGLPAELVTRGLGVTSLTPKGRIDIAAALQPRDGMQYTIDGVWQDTAPLLTLHASHSGGNHVLSLTGEGLTVSATQDRVHVHADRFNLGRLVQEGQLEAFLSGTLEHAVEAERWTGTLELRAEAPVESHLQFEGRGTTLQFVGEVLAEELMLAAHGSLLPTLDLSVQGRALDGQVELQGQVDTTSAGPAFHGALTVAAFTSDAMDLSLPGQRLTIEAQSGRDLVLHVQGDALELSLIDAVWFGRFAFPFSLQGEPHTLTGNITGASNAPEVAATFEGPVVQGPVRVAPDGAHGTLRLNPSRWLLGTAFSDPHVEAQFIADNSFRWQLGVRGEARYGGLPMVLNTTLEGRELQYEGSGSVSLAGEDVGLSVGGAGMSLQARATFDAFDLAAVSDLVPVALQGRLGGHAEWSNQPTPSFGVHLEGSGQAGGQAFALTVLANTDAGLDVSGALEGATFTLRRSDHVDAPFSLTLEDASNDLSLAGRLEITEIMQLRVDGRYQAKPLAVDATYHTSQRDGHWSAALGEADLSGSIKNGEVQSELRAPAGTLLPYPLSTSLSGNLQDDAFIVERFTFQADDPQGSIRLQLNGTALPYTQLSGTFEHPLFPALSALELTEDVSGFHLRLQQQSLQAELSLSPGFSPLAVSVAGTGNLPAYNLTLASDLHWSSGTGFSGTAVATSRMMQNDVELTFHGDGSLHIDGVIQRSDSPLTTIHIQLAPNPVQNPALQGSAQLELTSALASFWPGEPVALTGELEFSGTLQDPVIQGPVHLTGALSASGRLAGSTQGGTLQLSGTGLAVNAEVTPSGWHANSTLRSLDLSKLLPHVSAPRATGDLQATQRFGEPLSFSLDGLTLQAPRSRITGSLQYDQRRHPGLRGALELSLNLTDLSLNGQRYRGTVQGPLALGLATDGGVAGELTAVNVGLLGSAWGLGGKLDLHGEFDDPVLELTLHGEGSARGSLEARVAPAQALLELQSDLQVEAFTSNMHLAVQTDDVQASGTLGWRKASVSLQTAGNEVLITGSGAFQGWQGQLDTNSRHVQVQGNLTSLHPQLQGELSARLLWDGQLQAQLNGLLTNLQAGGIPLGDVQLAGSTAGDSHRATLTGEALGAEVVMSNSGLKWRVTRLALPLTDDVTLTAQGEGTPEQLELAGQLSGLLAGEHLVVPMNASLRDGTLNIEGGGEILAGRLELFAQHQEATGWTGEVTLADAGIAGADLSLTGQLSGPLTSPHLTGDLLAAHEALETQTQYTVSAAGLILDGKAQGTFLKEPLSFAGQVWPQLDLVLHTSETQALSLRNTGAYLESEGDLTLVSTVGTIQLSADSSSWLDAHLITPLPGLSFRTTVPRTTPGELDSLLREGLPLEGQDSTAGVLTVSTSAGLTIATEGLQWHTEAGSLQLAGSYQHAGGHTARLTGEWTSKEAPILLPYLVNHPTIPFAFELRDGQGRLHATSDLGTLSATLHLPSQSLSLDTDLTLGEGRIVGELRYTPEAGPTGTLELENVPMGQQERAQELTLSSAMTFTPEGLHGTGRLRSRHGSVRLEGALGWRALLPEALAVQFVPEGTTALTASARLDTFNLADLPVVAQVAPYLDAPISGLAQLQGQTVVGQILAPNLSIAGHSLPGAVEFNGTLAQIEVRATLDRSRINLTYNGQELSGLANLEGFPVHTLVEALLGETGMTSAATGVIRVEIPLDRPAESVLRVASERIQLEKDGVVTTGQVSGEYTPGRLQIDKAEFTGAGRWHASGLVSPEHLDFSIDASDANFTPLLSVFPQFASLGIGAEGSLSLTATGSLKNPDIVLQSPALDMQVSGSRYRIQNTSVTLRGETLRTSARIAGVAPLAGQLELQGGGRMRLVPFEADSLTFDLSGSLDVPTLGVIEGVQVRLTSSPDAPWHLDGRGQLGQPFTLTGTLVPLDLHLHGRNLNVAAPRYYLASSDTDVDLRVRLEQDYVISGEVFTRQARLALPARNTEDDAVAAPREPSPFMERILFDGITLRAPQQVRFQENIGSAELGLDLRLTGSAAHPELAGEAKVLRGSFAFSGRDFRIDNGTAVFDPSQGIYPHVTVNASTSYEKPPPSAGITVIAPRDSSTFDVYLQIDGEFSPETDGRHRLKLTPSLTSNALVQSTTGVTGADGVNMAGPRPLLEQELIALLTVGRLELGENLVGQGGLAGTVAQSAIDTALDLLVLSELQAALGEALGVDVLEIRTSSLGSLLEGGEADPFGVSLRLGGYVGEDLFASFRIGGVSSAGGRFALNNEFSLRYDLAPLIVNLSGGLNFLNDTFTPLPEFGVSLGYAVTPLTSFQAGVEVSSSRQSFGFGLNVRW